VVRNIEGRAKVVNTLRFCPVAHDDRIRRAAFRTIYSQMGLDRYALSAVPSIHIIVKNGISHWKGWWPTGPTRTSQASLQNRSPGIRLINNLALESN